MREITRPVSEETVSGYAVSKAEEANAITPEEADKKISQSLEDLLLLRDTANTVVAENGIASITRSRNTAEESDSRAATKTSQTKRAHSTVNTSTAPLSPKTTAPNKKRAVFDQIKEQNPDLNFDD